MRQRPEIQKVLSEIDFGWCCRQPLFARGSRGGVRLADPTGVKLTPAAPTAHVVLKLGPKWGILRGTVEDRTTHKPVVALLGFAEELGRGGSNEPHYLHGFFKRDAPGAFRILIPHALDLFLQVNAGGLSTQLNQGL